MSTTNTFILSNSPPPPAQLVLSLALSFAPGTSGAQVQISNLPIFVQGLLSTSQVSLITPIASQVTTTPDTNGTGYLFLWNLSNNSYPTGTNQENFNYPFQGNYQYAAPIPQNPIGIALDSGFTKQFALLQPGDFTLVKTKNGASYYAITQSQTGGTGTGNANLQVISIPL